MALQDLTPQLRTRLSRMERAVGWFVLLATALLVFGFGYYIYNLARNKGWFKVKAPYFTFTDSAAGLHEGDPVMMMGRNVGQITRIDLQPPSDYEHNIYVRFEIIEPYYGYLWTEGSGAKVTIAFPLGTRVLEVTKGTGGYPAYMLNPLHEIALSEARSLSEPDKWKFAEAFYDAAGTNVVLKALAPLTEQNVATVSALGIQRVRVFDGREELKRLTAVWNDKLGRYDPFDKANLYWLVSDESPDVSDRLQKLVGEAEKALPNILNLTNLLSTVLSNTATLTANLNEVAISARPAVSNLANATAQLDRPGALGEWLLPTNINQQLEGTLTSANTNLAQLAENLSRSLDSLASITSNLNTQVQANTNMLSQISKAVVDADNLVQGLKRHWLFRSAFKSERTNAPPPAGKVQSPKGRTGP